MSQGLLFALVFVLGLLAGAMAVLVLERRKLSESERRNARLETDNAHLSEQVTGQEQALRQLQEQLTSEFENISNRILKARSQEFSDANGKQLGDVLMPLRKDIEDFKKQVSDSYDRELRDNASLRAELTELTKLNQKVSAEANNLARALKGESKTQGNWGEVVLERVLELSGLQEGREFRREAIRHTDEGQTFRPDVIVDLPDKKQLVIDSKVSLTAYERYISAEEDDRQKALADHLASLKKHVRELAGKNYANLLGINSPDFVMMFVPIEASFSLALQADPDLFNYALRSNIVIVSPTTLLATLRTVASVWKQENQTRNALEIARKSGALYDKLVGFTEDFQKVKSSLDSAQRVYDTAYSKLYTGKGNVLTTAEKIKELGAKTSKSLPEA
ncbi:MAG: DNA recombination protein RmuC [Paludibacteraceae bacterium]|nr:DNA recombination protein RmuC [Paludibacteraceae bacterium]